MRLLWLTMGYEKDYPIIRIGSYLGKRLMAIGNLMLVKDIYSGKAKEMQLKLFNKI